MIDDDQIYVVVDIESDGPVAGLYSMLSLAAVATTATQEISHFYRTLQPLDGASQEPSTMDWWKTQPEAWQEVTQDAEPAETAINEFRDWIERLGKPTVFVAHPIGFDYAVVSWYLWKFAGHNPFTDASGSNRTLDLSSFIAGKFGLTLSQAKRNKLPEWMKAGMPEHSHNALDDARGYGVLLRNVLAKEA
jgi:DNA polymerase III alpha subunit (gram-positive type)